MNILNIHNQTSENAIYKLAELWKQQRDEAREENEWMRRVLRNMDKNYWLKWVDGPYYASGDQDEREFFHALASEEPSPLPDPPPPSSVF